MNRTTDREEGPQGTRCRAAAISLLTAAAFSALPAPVLADGPPARSTQPPGQKDPDKPEKAPPPGPMPVALDPASLRKRTDAQLEALAQRQAKLLDMALRTASSNQSRAEADAAFMKIPIGELPEELRPPNPQQVFEWGGHLLGGEPYTLKQYHKLMAEYWMEVASRYSLNATAVYNEICSR